MNNNNMAGMMNMYNQIMRMGANPEMAIQNMINQNPQARAIMNQMQQSGMTPKQFAMQYARQNGIDINALMNQMGIKL